MPTTIAIESHAVSVLGVDTPYQHLYLVKTITDANGTVLSEKVIRGTAGDDGTLTIQGNIDLEASLDARGSATLIQRHHTPLDLDGRNPNAVWNVMVQHAQNIDKANLPYGFDILGEVDGPDVNSNTTVASALHTIGIPLAQHLPIGISPGDVPLYDQVAAMNVNDSLRGTAQPDLIFGGAGSDSIRGGGQNDTLWGETGNDALYGETGDDKLYGGLDDDRLSGSAGNDGLYGQAGNDHLLAGSGSDRVSGGAGNDWLYGSTGNDILSGGGGLDTFVFNTKTNPLLNIDTVRDFSVRDDSIWLENKVFKTLGKAGSLALPAQLKAGAFHKGEAAHDSNDRLIYSKTTGALYYDADGTGAAAQVQIAQLSHNLKFTYKDLFII